MVGFWIMIYGVMAFADSFAGKKAGQSNWWLGTLNGILSVIIGFFITNNVLAGMFAITRRMGFGFLLAGFINIAVGFQLKPEKYYLKK